MEQDGPTNHILLEAASCAALMMDIAPLVLRAMRRELNVQEVLDLSVPQFRALRFVARRPGVSLSLLAEHLGMTLPGASKLLDLLLEHELVERAIDPEDRRRAVLTLTARGQTTLEAAYARARTKLAERLATLPADELATCLHTLEMLRELFIEERGDERTNKE